MHEFHPYPKWKYHPEKEAVIVENAKEEESLGPNWCNSPAEFKQGSSTTASIQTQRETIKRKKITGAK